YSRGDVRLGNPSTLAVDQERRSQTDRHHAEAAFRRVRLAARTNTCRSPNPAVQSIAPAHGRDGATGRDHQMNTVAAPRRAKTADYSELSLAGEYQLSSPTYRTRATITLPGDVHTALLKAREIPDPYFGANEQEVMWVNKTAWAMERTFTARPADIDGYLTLTLENVDTFATVILNG